MCRNKKVTVKLSLDIINYAPWGSGGIAPPFLKSTLDEGEWSASHRCRFIPGEQPPQCPLSRRLGGPQGRSRLYGEYKYFCSYSELNPGSSVVQSVA
jgi:hypothetical protein